MTAPTRRRVNEWRPIHSVQAGVIDRLRHEFLGEEPSLAGQCIDAPESIPMGSVRCFDFGDFGLGDHYSVAMMNARSRDLMAFFAANT